MKHKAVEKKAGSDLPFLIEFAIPLNFTSTA
jgi:hypothetical protein